jgi:hypothetical protein
MWYVATSNIEPHQKGKFMIKNKNIIIEGTNKHFSALGGLETFDYLYNLLKINDKIADYLPRKDKDIGPNQLEKFKTLIFGFISGAQCLDDLDILREDEVFNSICGQAMASTTSGEFLRSFNIENILEMRKVMRQLAFLVRRALFPRERDFIISMDSTPHEQYGKKTEGAAFNYQNLWCLDSIHAFDQFGFSYDCDLRPGNTYSAEGAEVMIHQVYKNMPKNWSAWFRADSAFGNVNIYNALLNKNAKFAIALKENVYRPLLEKYENQFKWKKTKLEFYGSKQCQRGFCLYPVLGLRQSYLKVVFIRAPKKDLQLPLANWDNYEYYAIITNINRHEMTEEGVIEFYRDRSNCENFIKDQKYGLDFHHFPCEILLANKAYFIAGAIAYNLLRYSSFLINKERGCFIKRVRFTLVNIGCQVVRHARKTIIRINEGIRREVQHCINQITNMFSQVLLE